MSIDSHITGVEATIGYTYQDKSLCAEALQMRDKSSAYLTFGGKKRAIAHSSRLALLGDRIIDAVLCKKWYNTRDINGHSSPLESYNEIRNELVSNKALGERGFQLGLDRFVIANPGTIVSPKMVADAFEAIVGAVSLDAGDHALDAVYQVLEHTGFIEHPMLVT